MPDDTNLIGILTPGGLGILIAGLSWLGKRQIGRLDKDIESAKAKADKAVNKVTDLELRTASRDETKEIVDTAIGYLREEGKQRHDSVRDRMDTIQRLLEKSLERKD